MKKKFRYLLISLFKYNQPTTEKPTSIYKMGGPNVDLSLIFFCFLIIPFNFGYLHIINSGSRKCIYKNSSDNLTKLLMIHEIYSCQWMILKKIKVLYIYIYLWQFVKLSATSSTYPPKRKETGINNQKMKRNSYLLKI